MKNLANILKFKFPSAVTGSAGAGDFQVCDNGDGVLFINKWDVAKLGTLPDAATLATWDAEYQVALSAKAAADAAETTRSNSIRADAGRVDLLNRLKTATPAQIDTWIDNNVTNIAAARAVLKAIIKIVALDART